MSDTTDPRRRTDHGLVTHQAPSGLLESSRHAPRTRPVLPMVLLAAAAGIAIGAVGTRALQSGHPEMPPGTRPVTLVYHADGAGRVEVAGSFNDWNPSSSPLHPVGDGAFRTVLWLPPGQYEYQFVVDGRRWQSDPLALLQRDDGFGAVNSVLEL